MWRVEEYSSSTKGEWKERILGYCKVKREAGRARRGAVALAIEGYNVEDNREHCLIGSKSSC